MPEKEIYYEMLWDCAQCNTTGLLGDSHRHCPTCGAAQDPTKRYFPEPGTEVEAKNHQFVGADWSCAYCNSPNSAAAAHCTNCGAGQDGTKPVATVVDTAAAPPTLIAPPVAAQSSHKWRWLLAAFALVVVALSTLFFSTHDATATVAGRNWQREIQIEKFGPVSDSAWCDSMPGDAYAVSQSREQRSTRQVPDGEVCRDERIDKGDGTFVKHRECSPRYRDEPVYDNRCRFQVNRWRAYRSVKAGSETAAQPMWPSIGTLNSGGLAFSNGLAGGMGAERAGQRSESYVLALQSDGKRWTCNVPESVWNKYQEGASLPIKVRLVGGAVCSSLK